MRVGLTGYATSCLPKKYDQTIRISIFLCSVHAFEHSPSRGLTIVIRGLCAHDAASDIINMTNNRVKAVPQTSSLQRYTTLNRKRAPAPALRTGET